MASNLIISRKSRADKLSETNDKETPIAIDSLPRPVIGECASFLEQRDYMRLSITNRQIHCATNSPNTLKELNLIFWDDDDKIDLNRFVSLKSLNICLKTFSHYSHRNAFRNLTKLHIFHNGYDENRGVQAFIDSNAIPFDQVTNLSLAQFGIEHRPYGFTAFCKLLSYFPNVNDLELREIHLSDYNEENEFFHPNAQILVKLGTLNCYHLGSDPSANLLRNKLLKMYSKQLKSISFNEGNMKIDTHLFPNLIKLKIDNPNVDSFKSILDTCPNIKDIAVPVSDLQNMKDSIISSFENAEAISLSYEEENASDLINVCEVGLFRTKQQKRKKLELALQLYSDPEPTMEQIELHMHRLVSILDKSRTENYRITFYFDEEVDKDNHRDAICKSFERTHLAAATTEVDDKGDHRIVISNKNCQIDGYRGVILEFNY